MTGMPPTANSWNQQHRWIFIYYLYSLYCALFHIFFLLFQYGILYNQQPWGLYTPDEKNIRTISKTPFILRPKHWQTYHWYVQKWRKWYPNFWQFSCQWWESDFLGYHGISWDTLFSDKAGTKEFTPVRLSKVDESNRSNTMEIVHEWMAMRQTKLTTSSGLFDLTNDCSPKSMSDKC